jgi:hypothetical protein
VFKRFFSDQSFWNTPIACNPGIFARDEHCRQLLGDYPGLHINVHEWTIPVYQADRDTPRYKLLPKLPDCPLSQGHLIASLPWLSAEHPTGIHASAQGLIPIPDHAVPDGENDAHMSVVDLDAGKVYDMWQVRRNPDGAWMTNAAIAYDLDGPGVFDPREFPFLHNNESIHYHGPCRASGVPNVAGLVMRSEIEQGRIEHKLAFACPVVGLQEFCSPPASWTDGWLPGGIPEGIVMQLSPDLALDSLDLPPAARIIARALQEYGAVLVDYSCGPTLYAEGLFYPGCERSWGSLLGETDLEAIGFENFRFLAPECVHRKGSHPVYHCGMATKFYSYLIEHNMSAPRPEMDR